MSDSKSESDGVSLRTLIYTPPSSSTDEAPPRYSDAIHNAQQARASSPSRSSFFSSPPMSMSEWTPDSASEFSEQQPFLSEGARTPPPGYLTPRRSEDTVMGGIDQEVGAIRLNDDATMTICNYPARNGRGCKGGDWCRKHRSREPKKFRLVICIIFFAVFIGYMVGFLVTRAVARRHQNQNQNHWDVPMPGWAAASCSSRDNRYNHYEFNDIHDLEVSDGPHGAFSGTIRVLPALQGQTADLVLKQIAKKTKALDIRVNGNPGKWSEKRDATEVVSSWSNILEKRGRCDADVVMHFRDGLSINNLRLETHAGRIQVYSKLDVVDTTAIYCKSGHVEASSFFNTRKTYIHSGSSSLEGHFKLYDLLNIVSTSGSIQITIDPQEVNKGDPKPAELYVESSSGSIRLGTGMSIPERDYVSTVKSRNGMIQGSLIHGSKTFVQATSGSIELDMLPYGDAPSKMYVSSVSGSQRITVREPSVAKKLAHMQSQHEASSGSMNLRYPSSWAGKIEGSTSSGSIGVSGSGVHVIDKDSRHIRAEKDSDDGSSQLNFRGQSGSVNLSFGV